ncbi:MAG: sel1 repeat family protein, partial [Paludibacteraceae bacterium]|nr:sel1 repeat family protein [Paludibacteraceae bacterium]
NNLGACYQNGIGLSVDYNKAVYWYLKSAKQGYSVAQFNLGACYQYGTGVTKDYSRAVYWYSESAEQGDAAAQNNLGWCYRNGVGVQMDQEKAVSWYMKSAEQGLPGAQMYIGCCYEYGDGVPQDYAQAISWFRKAAEQGDDKFAYREITYCYVAQNDFINAHKSIDVLINRYPENPFWYDRKGEICIMEKDTVKAMEVWERILQIDPEFADKDTEFYRALFKDGTISIR